MRTPHWTLPASLLLLGACGDDDPAVIAGEYDTSITNGQDTCELQNWEEGDETDNLTVDMEQSAGDPSMATATVTGSGSGLFLTFLLGTNQFEGFVDGNRFELTATGSTPFMEGNCTYTLNATMRGRLRDGEVIEGSVVYEPATNDNTDCEDIEGCGLEQFFLGRR